MRKHTTLSLAALLTIPLFLQNSCAVHRSAQHQTAHDAGISDSQYATIYDAFTTYDINNDGYIDTVEFQRFQQDPQIIRLRNEIPELSRSIPLLFEEIDEDGDGLISIQEMTRIAHQYLPQDSPK